MQQCESIHIAQALNVWWGGSKLDNYCINGYSTVWIGRLGKVLAVLGAIPILIDLFGEDRVVAAADRIRSGADWLQAKADKIYRSEFLMKYAPGYSNIVETWDVVRYGKVHGKKSFLRWYIPLNLVLSSVVFYAVYHFGYKKALKDSPFWVEQYTVIFSFIFVFYTLLALFIVFKIMPVVMRSVTVPLLFVFSSTRVAWSIRMIAAFLILSAFCLDLLTS